MNRKYLLIFLLTLSTLCYQLPYLSQTFYTQFLEAFALSNQQAGQLLTMFSLTATPGYLFGGMLADKFSPKKLVVISQVLTAAFGFIMTFLPGYTWLLVCYLGFGVSTTFIHWSAYLKLVRAQASENEEGKIFGFFEMCAAIIGAIMSYGILAVLQKITATIGFRSVTSIFALVLVLVALLIAFLVKDTSASTDEKENFRFSMVGAALKNPVTWLNGFIVMGLFAVISASNYLNPYLSGVFGVSVTFSTGFAIANRTLVRLFLAPIGGLMLDRLKTPRFLAITCICMMVLVGGLIIIPQERSTLVPAMVLSILLISVLALSRAGLYTPIPEGKVPFEITGTAMGIASAVGYSTDLWLYNLCGSWLDQYGNNGYRYVFMLVLAGLLLVIISAVLLGVYKKRYFANKEVV